MNQFQRNQVRSGDRYGALYVLGKDKLTKGDWLCLCDCGTVVVKSTKELKSGEHSSCGYCHSFINNGSRDRLYHVWSGMKRRCYNEKDPAYQYYGGRGIRICPEWLLSYQAFRDWALDNGYDEEAEWGEHTIDRIDVDGNYEPSNCRWVDLSIQQRNKRNLKNKVLGV